MKFFRHHFPICILSASLILHNLPCKADNYSQAKAAFERGTQAVRSEDYEQALDAFTESFRLVPKIRVLFNIAMCYKALGLYEEAIAAFREYLENSGQNLTPGLRSRAERALAEVIELQNEKNRSDELAERDSSLPAEAPAAIPASDETMEAAVDMDRTRADGEEPLDQKISDRGHEISEPPQRKNRALFISSLATLGLGVGAGVVGLVFNIQGQVHYDEANSYKSKWEESHLDDDSQEYNRLKDEIIPSDRIGMSVGYATAAVLLTTGAILLIKSLPNEKESHRAMMTFTHRGAVLLF